RDRPAAHHQPPGVAPRRDADKRALRARPGDHAVRSHAMDPTTALTTPLAELGTQARGYLEQSKAANTRRAYAADWRAFTAWCAQHRLTALPAAPETVALYLTAHAGQRKASTLQRRLVAIAHAHTAADVESPTRSAA